MFYEDTSLHIPWPEDSDDLSVLTLSWLDQAETLTLNLTWVPVVEVGRPLTWINEKRKVCQDLLELATTSVEQTMPGLGPAWSFAATESAADRDVHVVYLIRTPKDVFLSLTATLPPNSSKDLIEPFVNSLRPTGTLTSTLARVEIVTPYLSFDQPPGSAYTPHYRFAHDGPDGRHEIEIWHRGTNGALTPSEALGIPATAPPLHPAGSTFPRGLPFGQTWVTEAKSPGAAAVLAVYALCYVSMGTAIYLLARFSSVEYGMTAWDLFVQSLVPPQR